MKTVAAVPVGSVVTFIPEDSSPNRHFPMDGFVAGDVPKTEVHRR
jgi:hypothetical protein